MPNQRASEARPGDEGEAVALLRGTGLNNRLKAIEIRDALADDPRATAQIVDHHFVEVATDASLDDVLDGVPGHIVGGK